MVSPFLSFVNNVNFILTVPNKTFFVLLNNDKGENAALEFYNELSCDIAYYVSHNGLNIGRYLKIYDMNYLNNGTYFRVDDFFIIIH